MDTILKIVGISENTYKLIFRSFVIGSSFTAVTLHYLLTSDLVKSKKKYTFTQAVFAIPLFFGIINVIVNLISLIYNIPLKTLYTITPFITSLLTFASSYTFDLYDFSTFTEWSRYYLIVLLLHMIVIRIIIYNVSLII